MDNTFEFLEKIEAAGELVRVSHPVSVDREMTEIADRCMKSRDGGPALLFERPILEDGSESDIPVGINLYGSMVRMCLSLEVESLDSIGDRIQELLKLKVPERWREKLAMLSKVAEIAKFPPRTIKGSAPCQARVLKGVGN